MRNKNPKSVSVTDIAGLGICEQQAVLDAQFGKARSAALNARAKSGIAAHAKFDRQVRTVSDRRCFIASAVFGSDALETTTLRQFRDKILLPRKLGKALCRLYYAISPSLVPIINRSPRLAQMLRTALTLTINLIKRRWRKL